GQLRTERQAARLLAPVGLAKRDAMPGLAGAAQELVQTPPLALSVHFAQSAACSQELDEPVEVRVLPHQVPVEPTGFIVLAVGVVVPALAAPRFVTHQEHGHAQRQEGHSEKVLNLALAQLFDGGVVGGAFHTAIPTSVVIGPVAIVLAVGLVVLLVIGHQVVQGEAVVAGDKVNTLLGLSLFVPVNLGTAEETVGQPPDEAIFPPEKTAHVIAEASVPFLPTVADETADLVKAGGIPSFRNQLGSRQNRVRLDVPQHGRVGQDLARRIARED